MIHNHEVPSSILGLATRVQSINSGLFFLDFYPNTQSVPIADREGPEIIPPSRYIENQPLTYYIVKVVFICARLKADNFFLSEKLSRKKYSEILDLYHINVITL
jgi:hypothetical protein